MAPVPNGVSLVGFYVRLCLKGFSYPATLVGVNISAASGSALQQRGARDVASNPGKTTSGPAASIAYFKHGGCRMPVMAYSNSIRGMACHKSTFSEKPQNSSPTHSNSVVAA